MIQCKRVIAFDEIHVIMLVQNSKHKRPLDKLSRLRYGLYVEGFLLFQKLHGYVAICLYWCARK